MKPTPIDIIEQFLSMTKVIETRYFEDFIEKYISKVDDERMGLYDIQEKLKRLESLQKDMIFTFKGYKQKNREKIDSLSATQKALTPEQASERLNISRKTFDAHVERLIKAKVLIEKIDYFNIAIGEQRRHLKFYQSAIDKIKNN